MSDVSILVLPPERWREAKQLRLEALHTEPSAYASSYEDELSYPDEVWVKRVKSSSRRATTRLRFTLKSMAGWLAWSVHRGQTGSRCVMWRKFTLSTSNHLIAARALAARSCAGCSTN